MRSHSGKEKKTGKVHSPILPHTNFSLRAGQINQLILIVDAQFLGMLDNRNNICLFLPFVDCQLVVYDRLLPDIDRGHATWIILLLMGSNT